MSTNYLTPPPPEFERELHVGLDGSADVEISSILNHVVRCSRPTSWQVHGMYGRYNIDVNKRRYNLVIYDLKTLSFGRPHYGKKYVDFIIEVFAIDDPTSFKEIIDVNIPNIRKWNHEDRPIILVGLRSELRKHSKESELCPVALGNVFAIIVGGVKYVDCSAESGRNVYDIFEKGIYAFRRQYSPLPIHYTSYEKDSSDLLKKVLTRKMKFQSDEWVSILYSIDPEMLAFSYFTLILKTQLIVDKRLVETAKNSNNFGLGDVFFYRELEVQAIGLAEGYLDCTSFLTHSSSIFWCIDENKYVSSKDVWSLNVDMVKLYKSSLTSMRFVKQNCLSIEEFILSCAPIKLQRLMIINCYGVLSFRLLDALLEGFECLVIINTKVDFLNLDFPSCILQSLTHLVLKKCSSNNTNTVAEVPSVIGRLSKLEVLDITANAFTKLPLTFGGLHELRTLRVDRNRMFFPPQNVIDKPPHDVVQYLKAIQEEPVENKEAKLMIVGQEGVGKSTLVKSLSRWLRIFNTTPPDKTDGVEISVLKLNGTSCKVFDLAGDVEYLNTHSLFFSSNCLHIVVFNMSQFTVSRNIRSNDLFCRLELWLQTIACRDPRSCAIIVGTHADHDMLSSEVLLQTRALLKNLLEKYLQQHDSPSYLDCYLCNPERFSARVLNEISICSSNGHGIDLPTSNIPHIVGYYEVSGITNKNVEALKLGLETSVTFLKSYTFTKTIPKIWLSLRQSIANMLSKVKEIKIQPFLSLSHAHDIAYKAGLTCVESIAAMLRFFHSQGDFLWYEDIPEMKDVIILDPKWLSDQLRTLISYRASADIINEGVLHHSELPKLWAHMTEENRSRLINLFRTVGLCFSISENEELFPCKLPVGWPDREMWPPFPKPDESQASLSFVFSFVPPTFFPDLIVAINKKKAGFVSNVQPLYYRFNVVYITREQSICSFHEKSMTASKVKSDCQSRKQESSYHRIHFELMPYSNSLKVTIRGHNPCCMVPNIRSLIEDVISRRYPSITYKDRIICPECEFKKVQNPSSFELNDSHVQFCPLGHNFGSLQNILVGKLNPSNLDLALPVQSGRIFGETLEDHLCPKLFAVLPINLDSLSLLKRFVYSYLRDGYAVHLLCECPGEWHFLPSPGFRVGKPKEFFKKYGSRVCKLLRVISALSAPFKIASVAAPYCISGVVVANAAESARKELRNLLQNYLDKYPHLKASLDKPNQDLKDLKSSSGLRRSELSRFLEVKTSERDFGPLVCTFVDTSNEWLWLCEEHNQKYAIVDRS